MGKEDKWDRELEEEEGKEGGKLNTLSPWFKKRNRCSQTKADVRSSDH